MCYGPFIMYCSLIDELAVFLFLDKVLSPCDVIWVDLRTSLNAQRYPHHLSTTYNGYLEVPTSVRKGRAYLIFTTPKRDYSRRSPSDPLGFSALMFAGLFLPSNTSTIDV